MTEVKPNEEESQDLTPTDGDEKVEELEEDLFEEVGEDDKEQSEIDYINKSTNKKFTKEELVEYIKKVDKDYAQKKVVPVEEKTQTAIPSDIAERLLRVEEPLSRLVMDEMKKVSEKTGQSIEELWKDESGYFKGKAQALNEKLESEKRLSKPSNQIDGQEEDSEEKKMSKKFMKNFPPGIKIPNLGK